MTTPEQGTPEWLAGRRTGIGGSEISALYRKPDGSCAHPWMTQTRLWGLKTGRIPDDQPDPWEAPQLYLGTMLEPVVREMYATYSGRRVEDGVTLLRDPEVDILIANTDGTQHCKSRPGLPGIYEGKVTTVFRRGDWISKTNGETIETTPLHYHCQTQHYMGCTGMTWGSVCAFMQGDRFAIHWRDLERRDDFIADMRERSARWWRDYVVADKPPPVDAEAQTEAALREIHKTAEDFSVILPAAFDAVMDRLAAIADLESMAKTERQRLRNLVISTMGSASVAVIAGESRGWSFRGEKGRTLRSITGKALERARDGLVSRPTEISEEVEAILDPLYTMSASALASGQSLSAKAIHLANLAVLAANKITE